MLPPPDSAFYSAVMLIILYPSAKEVNGRLFTVSVKLVVKAVVLSLNYIILSYTKELSKELSLEFAAKSKLVKFVVSAPQL